MARPWVVRRMVVGAVVFAWPALLTAAEAPLVARASDVVLPCVGPALQASGAAGVQVVAGNVREKAPADILIGGSVEIDRALESGLAFPDSDESLGAVSWFLVAADGQAFRSLADVGAVAADVAIPAGPDADEVRRAVAKSGARTQERAMKDVRSAPLGVVPSWAGVERGTPIDVRPLRVRAAVSRAAGDVDRARAVVQALGSEAARRAFARCAANP